MKKYLSFIAGAALLLAAASCSKFNRGENAVQLPGGEYHEVTLNVGTGDALTRATSASSGEKAVNSVQVFAFDGGTLAAYASASTSSVTMTLRSDKAYTVHAVANCSTSLKSLTTVSAIQSTAIDLADEGRSSFFMYGSGTLAAGSASCTVTVKRIVARINLASVSQSSAFQATAGTMKIRNVFLSNVVGNQNLAGSASASTWYNRMGRYDNTQTHFVTTATAGAPAMTAADAPSLPYPFYCYPNSSSNVPAGWSTSFSGQHTMLVIAATFGSGSTVYYYPIDINKQIGGSILQNTTYEVNATISNYGSTDEPNREITSGSAAITVTAADWDTGATINKTI